MNTPTPRRCRSHRFQDYNHSKHTFKEKKLMTISTRKHVATPAKAPAAKKAAAKKPAAPSARRAAPAVASRTAVKPAAPTAPPVAVKVPRVLKIDEKRIRTSFALPESQIALLNELKKRCLDFGVNVKKGELLTAGLQLLKNLPETALEAAVLPTMRADRQLKAAKKRKK